MNTTTVRHVWYCLRAAARHPRVALLGAREFRWSSGVTYDGDPTSPRSEAYDSGCELAHIGTLRRWDTT